MAPITLLIKPASSSCNLKCKYCFYHDVAANREVKNYGLMSISTMRTLIENAVAEADDFINFAFQGGEPTLWGLENFQVFIKLVAEVNNKNLKTYFSLQTNGILIDEEWAKFLKQNKFLVGVSLDGYKEIHDMNRVDTHNIGSFNRVMKSIAVLNKYKVDYNILCVVNSLTIKHIDKIYNFYRKNNFTYLQFIPCLDGINEDKGQNIYSLTSEKYEQFLKQLFDRWYDDVIKNNGISIRHFDNWLSMLMGYPPESCSMNGICSCYFVVEADGSVYPCDFYVLDKYRLGNISTNGFIEMRESDKAKKFVSESKYIDDKCRNCKFYFICRGGCKRDKEPLINGIPQLNNYCNAYYNFFSYTMDRFMNLTKLLSKDK